MSKEAMKQHGAFSWNELTTSDINGAKAFYGALLGWTFQDTQSGDMTYTVIKMGDQDVGGITTPPPDAQGMPPLWGAYLTVDDVDARAAQAKDLGGKVCVPPQDIPNVGRFAVIQDPQGATLALITYLAEA